MPGAPYFPDPSGPQAGYMMFGPESSRRARAVADLGDPRRVRTRRLSCHRRAPPRPAQQLAALVDAAADLERLADVPLCIVCFRYRPPGVAEADLDELNRRLGAALLADGRVYAGTTVHEGKVALRPAMTNWRVTEPDVTHFVDVVREIGSRL